jgi:hypothetical protein
MGREQDVDFGQGMIFAMGGPRPDNFFLLSLPPLLHAILPRIIALRESLEANRIAYCLARM